MENKSIWRVYIGAYLMNEFDTRAAALACIEKRYRLCSKPGGMMEKAFPIEEKPGFIEFRAVDHVGKAYTWTAKETTI